MLIKDANVYIIFLYMLFTFLKLLSVTFYEYSNISVCFVIDFFLLLVVLIGI